MPQLQPNIIKTVATENVGIEAIAEEITKHKNHLIERNKFLKRREERTKVRIRNIVEEKIRDELWSGTGEKSLNSSIDKVVLGNLSPYHIADEIIENYKNQGQ